MAGLERFADFFYPSPDGLTLHARVYGERSGDPWPVVCLPGLTRNARDFHDLALHLSAAAGVPRRVVAFDYRGRGQSDRDPNAANYAVATEAADILTGLDALGIGHAAFVGTSRGGLIIHVLGTMRKAALKAIVLNDIGPVLEPAGLAHIRAYLGAASGPQTLADAAAELSAVHGKDFPALGPADWQRMAGAIYRQDDGALVADYDPAIAASLASIDLTQPLPTLWPQFDALAGIPLLAVRGANSRLLSVATLEEMRRRNPAMEAVTVAAQGHAPFLETGDLPGIVAGFIDRAEAADA